MDSEWQEQPKNQQAQAPGAQLAAQREAMGLSIDQIADQLKLAPRQVVAIEQGDYASLPNMAVTRGFIRAYAKVVRLDPAPLVAQIEVTPTVAPTVDHGTVRREKISTTFSESRFPSMTESRAKPKRWIVGGAVVLVLVAAAAAWQSGIVSTDIFHRSAGTETAAVPSQPGTETTALPAPNVPLVQPTMPTGTPAAEATPPAPVPAATEPPATAAATTPAPAAQPPVAATPAPGATPAAPAAPAEAGNALVLTVTQDSWIEVKRPGAKSLISRLVKAGSTETVEIDRQSTLVVGNPDGVRATLRGQPLALPKIPNGTISRVPVK
ncbi:helix-turn-helix domain-containing protein [Pseudoduganella plicata]|nr:RodZ domain-containing protein [Pseudoduganella plicata]QBQ36143.1 helix-turn-helix domain-containing protein [Pseudoduganella plicata]